MSLTKFTSKMCIRDRGKGGGGHAQQPDAAVGGGGGKARYVQKRPASHGNDVGMARCV